MNAKKCDRCTKLYENYGSEDYRANSVRTAFRDNGPSATCIEHFDLCPECMKSFTWWLKATLTRKEGEQNG